MKKAHKELEKDCARAATKAEQYQHQAWWLENRYHDYQESKREKRNHRYRDKSTFVMSGTDPHPFTLNAAIEWKQLQIAVEIFPIFHKG